MLSVITFNFQHHDSLIPKSIQRKINALCRQHRVSKLYAFGSVTSDEFDELRSDVDFLVELAPELKGDTYFKLQSELETILDRRVDLVLGHTFRNPYFAKAVEKSKQLVYAA